MSIEKLKYFLIAKKIGQKYTTKTNETRLFFIFETSQSHDSIQFVKANENYM